jgi:hypothetical protein
MRIIPLQRLEMLFFRLWACKRYIHCRSSCACIWRQIYMGNALWVMGVIVPPDAQWENGFVIGLQGCLDGIWACVHFAEV